MTASRETEEPSVKALCALFIVTTVLALLADAMPALAADLPDDRTPAPVYAPRARIYVVPGCRLGTERWYDGYGWHIRSIQVCR
jgi:hypothetical protein